MSEKFCPFRGEPCQENCGVWDAKEDRCSLVSIAQCPHQMFEMRRDLSWIWRAIEGLSQCSSSL